MSEIVTSPRAGRHVLALTGALFLSYLAVAMALPAVPLQVINGLGLTSLLGGLAVGIAFASTILTRGASGAFADRRGGKLTMQIGLLIYALAGIICAIAALPMLPPMAAYIVLLMGRLVLGLGESVAMVGMIGWAIGLAGPSGSGRVISMVGIGMYGSFALGGPLGLAVMEKAGFAGLMGVTTLLPLAGLLAIARIPAVAPQSGRREPLRHIVGRIWRQGTIVGLQGVGFAGLGAFFSLYFLARGWPQAGLGLTCFGAGFVAMRLIGGGWPDRFGGRTLAMACLLVEACGQYLIWLAPTPEAALVGAVLTGLGCSLVFPSMGAEVVKIVPSHLRSTAVGAFAAFQDVAYGLTGPVAGLVADRFGYGSVFLIGGAAATLGLLLTLCRSAPQAA